MTTRFSSAALLALLLTGGCTGGTESKAADEKPAASNEAPPPNRRFMLRRPGAIHRAIPIYEGADFREDLTRSDEVTIRNRYGPGATV